MSSRAYHTSSLRMSSQILHGFAVRRRDRHVDGCTLAVVELAVTPRHREARHQSLDVPLEGARQGLVEVVEPEDETTVWCREHPEVRQVRVAAQLDRQVRAWRVGKVGGHQVGGTTVEGERGHQHPAVPEWDQLLHATGSLLLEQGDGVGPIGRRLPLAEHRTRHLRSGRLPRRGTLGRCEVGCACRGLDRVHQPMSPQADLVDITHSE